MVKNEDNFNRGNHKLAWQNMRKMQGWAGLYCVLFHTVINSKGSTHISVHLKKSVHLKSQCTWPVAVLHFPWHYFLVMVLFSCLCLGNRPIDTALVKG